MNRVTMSLVISQSIIMKIIKYEKNNGGFKMILQISNEELLLRQKNFINEYEKQNIEATVIFNPIDIFYLTGFNFSATERPIALLIDPKKKTHIFVPLLERD